jgi:hypothetical protein
MHFVMLANFYKTPFWLTVADRLIENGHSVQWLSPSRKWSNYIQQTSPGSSVVDLSSLPSATDGDTAYRALKAGITDPSIPWKDLILVDRRLSMLSSDRAQRYLGTTYQTVDSLVAGLPAGTLVIGEATWAWEILTAEICRNRGITYLCPHTLRIPDDRFTLFEGIFQTNQSGLLNDSEALDGVEDALSHILEREPQPYYWAMRSSAPRPSLRDLTRAREKVVDALRDRSGNPTQKRLVEYLTPPNRVTEIYWGKQSVQYLQKVSVANPAGVGPYALLTLHRQPEASIDVLGWRTRDQKELVARVAQSLPAGTTLAVKEHVNALGDRPAQYLKQLASVDGVRLVNPFANTWEWIRSADLVVTVSGTAGYEAGLLGKPVVTTAPMFFGALPTVNCSSGFVDLQRTVQGALATPAPARTEIVQAFSDIVRRSARGRIGDVRTDPSVLDQANIDSVARALDQAAEAHARDLTTAAARLGDDPRS